MSPAFLVLCTHPVEQEFFVFIDDFVFRDADNPVQDIEVHERNHAAEYADDAPLDAKLDGSEVEPQNTVPKQHKFHQKYKGQVP